MFFSVPLMLCFIFMLLPSGSDYDSGHLEGPCSLSLHAEAHPLFLWGFSDLPVGGSLLGDRGSRTETTEASYRMLHLLAFSNRKQGSTIFFFFFFFFFLHSFILYISQYDHGSTSNILQCCIMQKNKGKEYRKGAHGNDNIYIWM